ncbi:transcriptional repressor NrdR [Striga asiatica]|uniref:Transcriptional repressor NrdR n=1 Tax=Striga asiatica TaxID=4170 RepID=A0A5A7QMD4_STRAF|nr:transcriptional repressor NrdR [Striga asiatica]
MYVAIPWVTVYRGRGLVKVTTPSWWYVECMELWGERATTEVDMAGGPGACQANPITFDDTNEDIDVEIGRMGEQEIPGNQFGDDAQHNPVNGAQDINVVAILHGPIAPEPDGVDFIDIDDDEELDVMKPNTDSNSCVDSD